MGSFIAIFIIGLVIYLIVKSLNKSTKKVSQQTTKQVNLPFEISSESPFENQEEIDPVKSIDNKSWILNPGTPFELTVINADENEAVEIRSLLENKEIPYRKKEENLISLFASRNLKIKEIEEYKNKYKQQYFDRIESLKSSSPEWNISGEKDKEDLLIEFRQIAINSIYERADCDLIALFECEPKDMTLDDELINEYGFESVQTYLTYVDDLDRIRIIPNDNFLRPGFEKLVEYRLAKRGNELSKEEILSTLTLRELNLIASNPEKEYKRKNQAIEYILTLDNLEQKISENVSLRELFKLNQLPSKYDSLDLKSISSTIHYHTQEIRLLVDTYRKSASSWRDLKYKEYIKGYTIEPSNKENPCPYAKERSEKKYSKNDPPKVPFHIGCNCYLSKEYN